MSNAAKLLSESAHFRTILHLLLISLNLIGGDCTGRLVKGFQPSRILQMCNFRFPDGTVLLEMLAKIIQKHFPELSKFIDQSKGTIEEASKGKKWNLIFLISNFYSWIPSNHWPIPFPGEGTNIGGGGIGIARCKSTIDQFPGAFFGGMRKFEGNNSGNKGLRTNFWIIFCNFQNFWRTNFCQLWNFSASHSKERNTNSDRSASSRWSANSSMGFKMQLIIPKGPDFWDYFI